MTAKDRLVAARKKIEDPANWIKGRYAADANGEKCLSYADEACKFCALGALFSTEAGYFNEPSVEILYEASHELGFDGVTEMNDDERTDHPKVMALYDKAIELAIKKETDERAKATADGTGPTQRPEELVSKDVRDVG